MINKTDFEQLMIINEMAKQYGLQHFVTDKDNDEYIINLKVGGVHKKQFTCKNEDTINITISST